MRNVLSAMVLNLGIDDISTQKSIKIIAWLLPLAFAGISWAIIIFQMVFTYRAAEGWTHMLLVAIYSFLYSLALLLLLAIFCALIYSGKTGFVKGYYLGILSSTPIIVVCLISLIMQYQAKTVRVLGHFPEHPLIIGAYITIFSYVRLIAARGKAIAIISLFLLCTIMYFFLGPLMFKLFRL